MIARELKPGQRFYFTTGPIALRTYSARSVDTTEAQRCNTYGAMDTVATTRIVTRNLVLNVAADSPVELVDESTRFAPPVELAHGTLHPLRLKGGE